MSLHRQSQFQRAHRQETADSCRSPLSLSGDICPSMLATGWCVAFGAAPRPVNRPLGPSSIRVNNLFAILFQKLSGDPEKALTRRVKWGRNRGFQGHCRGPRKCGRPETSAMRPEARQPDIENRAHGDRRLCDSGHLLAAWPGHPAAFQLEQKTDFRLFIDRSPRIRRAACAIRRRRTGPNRMDRRAVAAIRRRNLTRAGPPRRSLRTRYSRASPRLRLRCGRFDI